MLWVYVKERPLKGPELSTILVEAQEELLGI